MQSNKDNIQIYTDALGVIELRPILVKDLRYIFQLVEKKLYPKLFTLQVLHRQIINRRIAFSQFRQLPERDIIKLSQQFLMKEHPKLKLPEDNFFKKFKQIFQDRYDDKIEVIALEFNKNISSAFSSFSSIIDSNTLKLDLSRILSSPAIEIAKLQVKQVNSILQANKSAIDTCQGIARSVVDWLKLD